MHSSAITRWPQTCHANDNHGATLRLSAAGEVRNIPLEFVVRSVIGAGIPTLDVDDDNQQAPIVAGVAIESLDPAREFPWSATLTGLPWLSITKASGQTGVDAGATLQLLPDAIRTLPNGVYMATLRIESSSPGVTPVDVPVYVGITRTFVDAVSPAVEAAGYAGQVLVSVDRQDDLAPIQRVWIGDVAAPAFVSRTRNDGTAQLQVTVPPLVAGRYPVTLESQSGRRSHGRAELILVDEVDYTVAGPTAQLSTSGSRFVQVFDASRRTVYSLPNGAADYVYAARFDGTGWVQSHSTATFSSCHGAALAANARSLVGHCQTSAASGFVELDPDSLELTNTSPAVGSGSVYPQGLSAMADGSVWIGSDFGAAVYTPARVTGSIAPDVPLFYLAASESGNAVLSYHAISPGAPLRRVDPFTGTATPFLASYPLSLHDVRGDRFGTRWALIGEVSHSATVVAVYDQDGAFRGQVDYRPLGSYVDASIDEDGTRLYILGASFLPEINGGIAVYDLTQPPVENRLVLLGKIPMTAVGAQWVGATPDGTQVFTSDGDRVQASRLELPPP
jgi:hypothetical protein